MFGMGLGEIFIIIVIAILFLGPDKLPTTMIEIAKFFRNVKSTVNSARSTIEEEMRLSEIKEEALNYKKQLTDASSELERMTNMTEVGAEIQSIKNDLDSAAAATPSAPAAPKQPEVITFEPKSKKTEPASESTTQGNA